MSTSRLAAVCDPTQWVQFLIAINIHVNQETHRYAITKKFFQGGLSAVTAVTCIPACGTEIIKLVGDVACKGTGGAVRGVQCITNPAWLERFYQTVSGRPSLSYRVERIVGQAFGLLISACGTLFLIFLRDDWAIQQHQSLGNYTPSKTSPPKTSDDASSPQASESTESASTSSPEISEAASHSPASEAPKPVPPPPSPKATTPLTAALKASPTTPTPSLADSTGSSPTLGPTLSSGAQAAGSEPPPEASSTSAGAPSEEKKKGVHFNSNPIAPPAAASPAPSFLDLVTAKGTDQAAKGAQVAEKLAQAEATKAGVKKESDEQKALKKAVQTKKPRRVQSVFFTGFDETLGNLVDCKIQLSVLAKNFQNLPFSTDETVLAGTFGEYICLKFEEEKTPIKVKQVCVIENEEWGTVFTITITKIEQDPATGKTIVVEAALSW